MLESINSGNSTAVFESSDGVYAIGGLLCARSGQNDRAECLHDRSVFGQFRGANGTRERFLALESNGLEAEPFPIKI